MTLNIIKLVNSNDDNEYYEFVYIPYNYDRFVDLESHLYNVGYRYTDYNNSSGISSKAYKSITDYNLTALEIFNPINLTQDFYNVAIKCSIDEAKNIINELDNIGIKEINKNEKENEKENKINRIYNLKYDNKKVNNIPKFEVVGFKIIDINNKISNSYTIQKINNDEYIDFIISTNLDFTNLIKIIKPKIIPEKINIVDDSNIYLTNIINI